MAVNAIEKYNLESLAYDLKNSGKSYAEIAVTLSETAGAKISKSMVFRYFESHENVREEIVQNIIDRNETLVVTSMAQTLDVNAFRIRLTSSLMALLETKLKQPYQDGKEIAAIAKEIRESLKDYDQPFSSLSSPGAVDHNLGVTLTDDQLLQLIRVTETDSS